jgi:small subunit ribosomal protein S16
MLAIRMQRTGRKGHATFRIIVQDSRRTPTSGKVVAFLGNYDPHTKSTAIEKEKAQFYLDHGAQPSDRISSILKAEGVKLPTWVKSPTKKERSVRHPDKRRATRSEAPAEEASPAPEESAAESPEPAIPEAASEESPAAEAETTDTEEATTETAAATPEIEPEKEPEPAAPAEETPAAGEEPAEAATAEQQPADEPTSEPSEPTETAEESPKE